MCANRRPVRGRKAQAPPLPEQAHLVPLAEGHAVRLQPAATTPFGTTAPESTFSLAQVRDVAVTSPGARTPMADIVQHVRTTPPSFREIRAAAATRAPIAQVRIPVAEAEGGTLLSEPAGSELAQASLPGMDQLVERVRQRTAARLSRFSIHAV